MVFASRDIQNVANFVLEAFTRIGVKCGSKGFRQVSTIQRQKIRVCILANRAYRFELQNILEMAAAVVWKAMAGLH
jgi:hypothetical protein